MAQDTTQRKLKSHPPSTCLDPLLTTRNDSPIRRHRRRRVPNRRFLTGLQPARLTGRRFVVRQRVGHDSEFGLVFEILGDGA